MPIENKRTPRGAIEIKKDTALGVLTSSRTACISSTHSVYIIRRRRHIITRSVYIITHSVYIINASGVVYHPPQAAYHQTLAVCIAGA